MTTALPMLSFLLLVLAAVSFPGALGASSSEYDTYVFDVFGNMVRFADEYYIETSIGTSIKNSTVLGVTAQEETCPHVRLSTNHSQIMFTRTPIFPPFVTLGQSLNIQSINNPCNTTTTLLGINTNIAPIPWFVVIGGHDYNVFKIEKFNPEDDEHLYKLSYCPYNPLCHCVCVDVGYQLHPSGAIYLTPGGKELSIVFRPANICKAEVV